MINPPKLVDQHLEKVVQKIQTSWGVDRPLFLDFSFIPPSELMSGGEQPLAAVAEQARAANVRVIPVTGIDRTDDYQSAVKDDTDKLGICFRLAGEDFEDMQGLEGTLNSLLDFFGVSAFDVDVVIDFESVIAESQQVSLTNSKRR